MKNTIKNVFETLKNILLIAMISGIASFIAGTSYQAHADSHVKTVTVTVPAPTVK